MNPERWQKIEELFNKAVDMRPGERTAWVSRNCGGDVDLREEVLALLASDPEAQEFVEDRVRAAVIDLHETEAVPKVKRCGPYRLVRELGRGGMGTVCLAERADEEYQGQVAIKLIRPGMDTDFFLTRFRRERQTLARLQHPNIARLLDSGTTHDGMPYIVMELIEGRPIHDYCADKKLSIEQTLQLFLPVCSAVAHAHQHFVVHRDLKPGNILVDESGTPKLLDFGICKLLFGGGEPVEQNTQVTAMMTPDYASPEQVRADPITAASDIYSLGAVLYQLLTGALPHRIERYSPREVERAICEEEAVRPSQAAQDRNRKRQLAGDLDNILLKALQKDPERRYASVEQFADDLKRCLEYRPVSARADTLGYRFQKFSKRNSRGIAAVATIAVVLAGGIVVSSRQANEARRNFADSRRLANAMLFEVHDQVRNLPGSLKARQSIVRLGMQYLDRLSASSRGNTELQRELAAGYQRLGEIQGDVYGSNLGQQREALASFRKALDLLEPLPESRQVQLDKSVLYRSIGDVQSATDQGADALRSFETGASIAEKLHREDPTDDLAGRKLASLYAGIGSLEKDGGRHEVARAKLNRSIELYRAYVAKYPDDQSALSALSSVTVMAGGLEEGLGRLTRARDLYKEVVEQDRKLCALDPTNQLFQRELAPAYSHLGDLLGNPNFSNLGDIQGAREAFGKMLELTKTAYERNTADESALIDYGMAYMRVANLPASDYRDQVATFRKGEALLDRAKKANLVNQANLAALREQLGDVLAANKDYDGAREAYRKSLTTIDAVQSSVVAAVKRIALTVSWKLGEDAARRGETGLALTYGQKALAIGETAKSADPAATSLRLLTPRSYAAMGFICVSLKRKDDARGWLERALTDFQQYEKSPAFNINVQKERARVELALRSR